MSVRKAVFPAAGLGTRFLPATKAQPKEMLPLVDKPTIQYVVEEAVASGLSEIIIVTGRNKRAIEDHFDAAFELEYYLNDRGKVEELAQIKTISELASVCYVRQKEPLGLGHAILVARPLVGDEPFGVFLGDDIIGGAHHALHEAAPRRLRQVRRPGDRRRARAARAHPSVRRDRRPQHRRQRVGDLRSRREAAGRGRAVRSGHHRPLRADARCLRHPGRDRRRPPRRDPAHRRPAHAAPAAGRCTPWSSRASATTPATSSASSRRPWSSRWPGRTWPTPSGSI